MKKLVLSIATLAVVGVAGLGVSQVSAVTPQMNGTGNGARNGSGNGYQTSLETRAKALGVTTEELQKARDEGRTTYDVAKDKGISVDSFQAKMRDAAKARWESRGLSAEEVAERTKWQADRQADCDGTGAHQGEGGYGRHNR